MTKMATVQAQQMWEYMSITRKTADFLIAELNEVGKLGWELVNAAYHRDLKSVGGSYSWTAVLKRPLVIQSQHRPPESTAGANATAELAASEEDADTSIFDLQPSEDEPENTGDHAS
ncbi:MAG: hypothetical protein JW888_04865 [Pirellulales bacterium]|nr:hypothetical protein [Pirellulales bacterium]